MDNFNISKYFKKQYLTEAIDDESAEYYFDYLTKLRDSGVTNMFGAGSYLQAEFGVDKQTARQILAKWMRSFDEPKEKKSKFKKHGEMSGFDMRGINEGRVDEFVGGELESRNEVLYDKLVPSSGNSDFIEGEILRAINKIVYRFYNDGDYFYKGYGAETAGPSHSFLTNSREIPLELQSTLTSIFNKAIGATEDGYERLLKLALEKVLDYIEDKAGNYTESNEDMLNYDSEFQDEEDYDDDYDDYGDEEDDDYYQ